VCVIRNFPVVPAECKRDYHSSSLRLIYVGDVRRVRGIGEYVTAVDRLRQAGVPVELTVVGAFADAGEAQQITADVQRLGLGSRVVFLGRRPPEDIPSLLLGSDVGLALLHGIGNYRESYPTKMFEYMAAGLPVLASRFPLWEDVLVGSGCGRVADPENVDEIVELLHEYWRSPELLETHGRRGRAAVLHTYNWEMESTRLTQLYGTLLRGPEPGLRWRGRSV
jgi:glycosyltransferase involved in cell wall biosynthesis